MRAIPRAAAIAASVAVLIGCAASEREWQPTTHPAGQTREQTDQAVLEAVLMDLATSEDGDSQQVRKEQRLTEDFADTHQVLFSNVCRQGHIGTILVRQRR